ncbi:MAG: DNA mismatch repair endonuclease MutL [Betaproteobacteria bacterium]
MPIPSVSHKGPWPGAEAPGSCGFTGLGPGQSPSCAVEAGSRPPRRWFRLAAQGRDAGSRPRPLAQGLPLGNVRRLPDDLVNKIAAGEVVERPASVVKELVENALDAGARSVHVEIEEGGLSLVRVRDDGCGMGRADAEMALERHATSKLRQLSDLQAIATHGFRGEALPSIAAVSELLLRTRAQGETAGTEVAVGHGRRGHVRDAGHPRGTTVEVRDLFGAVPARRKFLRSPATEAAHVAETVTLSALAQPGTGFSLRSGGRLVLEAPAVDGLAARIFQVFGAGTLADLVPVEGGSEWAVVRGFVSRPDRPRPTRPDLRLFVNRRAVRDRALSKAVLEAFRSAGAGERGFLAFLFVELPAHLVDVNVHPAKTEVRFADPRRVFAAVESAVREALSGGVRVPPAVASSQAAAVEPAPGPLAGQGTTGHDVVTGAQLALERFGERASAVADGRGAYAASAGASSPGSAAEADEAVRGTPRVLGQHRLTYIVASDGDELVLVDQHTAHERVRFEQLLERAGRRLVESQGLVVPAIVELAPELRAVLEAHAEALAELGYDVEAFGAGATRLRAVPAVLGTADPGPSLERLLRDLKEREGAEWAVAGSRDRLAATLACHSAVRAGQALAPDAMTAILRDLQRTAHPTLCPHGRPTVVRVPRDELSRWFGRTGWRRR